MTRVAGSVAFGLFLLAVGAGPGMAQSFNCATNTAPDEQAICSSARLSALDEELSGLYNTLLNSITWSQAKAVRNTQRAWLNGRAACRWNVSCLQSTYHSRISQLELQLNRVHRGLNP